MTDDPGEDRLSAPAAHELLDDIDAVVCDRDPRTLRPRYVSRGAERLLGYPAADWLSEPEFFAQHLHADDRERVLHFRRTETAAGRDHQLEYRMLAADGREVWVREQARVVADAAGHATRLRCVLTDIGAQKRSEETLRTSEEHHRAVIAALTEGIILVDPQGRVQAVNEAGAGLYGVTAATMLGSEVGDPLYAPRDEAGRLLAVADRPVIVALRTGRPVQDVVLRIRPVEGPERWLLVNTRPLFRPGETTPYLAVASLVDITEKRRLEEMLRQTQKLEAVGRLAGGIAHDFNNLLTAVRGYSDLLMEELAPDDPRRAHVDQIRGAGERAANLTRQLLAFGRRQRLEPRALDLRLVLHELLPMLQRLAGEHIRVSLRDAAPACWLRADRGQLEQVVLNLVLNARDAMPGGGELDLAIAEHELRGDEPRLVLPAPAGSYVRLTVRDTGSGMDADTLAHIFEPFFTTKLPGEGTGLGLSSVYGVVQQSGGAIAVTSEPGRGTTFEISLPAVREPADAALGAGPVAPAARGSERVLVVEDEPMVRGLVTSILRGAGYEVAAAADAAEGLQVAEHGVGFRILVTDVVMPGMNGVELARRLRARWPALRVLLISGYSDGALLSQGSAPGVPLLAKPFSPQDLLARVRELLDAPALAGGAVS